MSNNEFIEEDFERISAQEMSYIQEEKRRAMLAEWEEWDIMQQGCMPKRQPAMIKVIMPKEQTHET